MRLKTPLAILATAVLAVGLSSVTTASAAQTAVAGQVFCVNKTTKIVRALKACNPKTERTLTIEEAQQGIASQGPRGERGLQGAQGERGLTGQQGQKGDPGRDGVDGKPGAQGEPGKAGETGARGDPVPPVPRAPTASPAPTARVSTGLSSSISRASAPCATGTAA
ncbi:hypothetical protein [Streptosporangium sp. NPDC006007]|uniref:hypothetical protein n=1 Tax=Streptosporangium sp. NPDC006007 TaxID=3154575 RepID=UPI0033B972A4